MRTKQDYVLNQKNGKFVPEKVGLKAVQRNDLDYEFTLVFDIDIKHFATSSKDRTGLFMDTPEFIINAATGRKILNWCSSGAVESIDTIVKEIEDCKTVEGLRKIYVGHPQIQEQIKALVLEKKVQIESIQSQVIPNEQIINQDKNQDNGIDSSE